MDALERAARELAGYGWPVLPVRAGAKEPLTRNGVKDATTDPNRVAAWWGRWPDANVGIATGSPGPQVLDIDNLEAAAAWLPTLEAAKAPEVATPRGRHFYFAGNANGTVALGYGELRGFGSYVVAPPSLHPSGKLYTWLREPNGALVPAPAAVTAGRTTKGAGPREPRERVPHGERHDYLTDHAVRLVRSGITDEAAIERALIAEYDAVCDKTPAALPMYFAKIAKWAAGTHIADRERARTEAPAKAPKSSSKGSSKGRTLTAMPARDAPLGELRGFVAEAMGLPDVLRIGEVRRFGPRLDDALHIYLSNEMRVEFDAQGDVTKPGVWRETVTAATASVARPMALSRNELGDVFWALCVVSTVLPARRFEDDLQSAVDELVDMCETVRGTLEPKGRYPLLELLAERPQFDPYDRGQAKQPALIDDMRTGERFLRAGELMAYASYRRLGISARQFPGRMAMIGLERRTFQAWDRSDTQRSRRRRTVLYRLPAEEAPE